MVDALATAEAASAIQAPVSGPVSAPTACAGSLHILRLYHRLAALAFSEGEGGGAISLLMPVTSNL